MKKFLPLLSAVLLALGCSDSSKTPVNDTTVVPTPPGVKVPKLDKPGLPSVPAPKKGVD